MKIKSVILINYGIIESDSDEPNLSEGSLTGYFLRCDQIYFIEETNIIPAEKGIEFGISYWIEGFSKERSQDLCQFTGKIIHPEMVNPVTLETSKEIIDFKSFYLNHINFDYFRFEYDWEIRKGKWTFQVLEGKRILLEKEFFIK